MTVALAAAAAVSQQRSQKPASFPRCPALLSWLAALVAMESMPAAWEARPMRPVRGDRAARPELAPWQWKPDAVMAELTTTPRRSAQCRRHFGRQRHCGPSRILGSALRTRR